MYTYSSLWKNKAFLCVNYGLLLKRHLHLYMEEGGCGYKVSKIPGDLFSLVVWNTA